jgi:hypothetical protein
MSSTDVMHCLRSRAMQLSVQLSILVVMSVSLSVCPPGCTPQNGHGRNIDIQVPLSYWTRRAQATAESDPTSWKFSRTLSARDRYRGKGRGGPSVSMHVRFHKNKLSGWTIGFIIAISSSERTRNHPCLNMAHSPSLS